MRTPRYDAPSGLSDAQRVAWLLGENKVVCFIRGTKQQPRCKASDRMVQLLSTAAFDTNTRFAALDIAADTSLGAAVLARADRPSLPLCFIDGECVGGAEELLELDATGELTRSFGGEQLVAPYELDWRRGARTPGGEGKRRDGRAHAADAGGIRGDV